jgi:hypothetical protein
VTRLRTAVELLAGFADLETDVEYAAVEKADDLRYTFGPMYMPDALDAHDEFATDEDLREATWAFNLGGERTLRKQHGQEKIGDIVELARWPFEHEAELAVPGTGQVKKVLLPANTPYMGVHWTEEAWPLVKSGRITGYSIGGRAVRIRGLPTEGLAKLK